MLGETEHRAEQMFYNELWLRWEQRTRTGAHLVLGAGSSPASALVLVTRACGMVQLFACSCTIPDLSNLINTKPQRVWGGGSIGSLIYCCWKEGNGDGPMTATGAAGAAGLLSPGLSAKIQNFQFGQSRLFQQQLLHIPPAPLSQCP